MIFERRLRAVAGLAVHGPGPRGTPGGHVRRPRAPPSRARCRSPGRRAARRDGHAHQPHPGQRAHHHDRHRRPLRLRHRPAGHLHAPGELQGFKTLERTNLVVNANDRLSAGALTMDVGAMTEEVTVSSRVSELQTTSGERSFALENEALTNIANNGRQLFNFAMAACRARCRRARRAQEIGSVSGFTVNGQRPNSNNMTIDGVANIDTGDNGGNMATTNIDAVAEFKVLTNSYQAEYGRAVGAQLQVVTKSGSRDFHGSGYWYGRRSDWNANIVDQQARHAGGSEGQDQRATTAATRSAARCSSRASTRTRRSCSSSSARSTSAASRTRQSARDARADRARAARRLLAERRQRAATRSPTSATTRRGLPVQRRPTRAAASRTAACSAASREPPVCSPASRSSTSTRTSNFSGAGSGLNFTSQDAEQPPRREDLLRMDYQATDNWRVTGRYMNTKEDILQAYGTTWAGNGSDQLPTPTLFLHPGSNYMLSATGVLSPRCRSKLSWGRAANSLNYELQLEKLFRANSGTNALPYLYPGRRAGRLRAVSSSSAAAAPPTPASTRPTAGRSPTRTSPTTSSPT